MSGIFGGGGGGAPPPQIIQQPVLEQPAPMPVPDKDAQTAAAYKQMVVANAGKTTRQNTIIGDTLGGG